MRWESPLRGVVVLGLLAAGFLGLQRVAEGGRARESDGARYRLMQRANLSARLAERLANPDPSLPSLPADYSGPEAPRPVVACYDPDNPPSPEVIQRMEETLYGLSLQYQLGSRWSAVSSGSAGTTGNPIVITWSFIPDGLNIPSSVGEPAAPSNLFAEMDSKFGGNRALWKQRITDAFTRWGQLVGVTYQHITFGGNEWDDGASWGSAGQLTRRGDVRIGMKSIDGGGGILAYDGMPNQSDMVLDADEGWGSSASTHRFLRNVVAHEHGHGMGMAHVCPINNTKLLEPFYTGIFDGPQQDDIRALQRFYGDPNESDNTAATATDLGTRNPSTSVVTGNPPSVIPSTPNNYSVPTPASSSALSIDADGEQDWFKFTINQPLLVTVTVSPIGSTYDDNAQAGQSCPSGNPVNAQAQADLRLQLIAANGATTIATAEAFDAGTSETLSQVLIPTGFAYIRVTEANTAANPQTETQLYRFTLATGAGLIFSATDGTHEDRVALGWTAIPNVISYSLFRNTVNDRVTATLIANPPTNTHDDTTATPGVTYYYWIQATQFPGFAADFGGPETGFRAEPPPPECPADFNDDGFVNPDDLADYITCFFLQVQFPGTCPPADFNQDLFVNPDDLADYITTFFNLPC
jgi:hypothetical protein